MTVPTIPEIAAPHIAPRPPARRAWRWVSPAVGVALFAAALLVLNHELRQVSYGEVRRSLRGLSASAVLLSVLLTAANYAVLCGFDLLAFRYVGRRLTGWKVAVASFIGYAVANSVGFALISGTSVRYRFYSRWGLSAPEISRIVVFYSGTFWLGFLVLAGWSLAVDPHPGIRSALGPIVVTVVGCGLLAAGAGYVAAAALHRAPLRLGRWTLPFPPMRMVAGQFVLSTVDWALSAGVLFALLPRTELSFWEFLSAFLAAQVLGLVSHVPGGVGVFEGTMIVLLDGYLTPSRLLSSLLLYRLVYYVLPLAAALAVLVTDELRQRRRHLARWDGWFGALSLQLALDGAGNKPFRLVLNRFARGGLRFRVVPRDEVPALLPALREVSDAWLATRRQQEKGFSLGFFSPEYVARFPAAVVEEADGRIAAFATAWPGAGRAELSVDLMRYRPDAPRNVMEALLLNLMLWGREEGYGRFDLGMAPLSGLEPSPIAPVWTRVGSFLFARGEALYNFQGLRTYKEKFHPAWEPRYLAYPGGLVLPRITADVSALIARGYGGLLRRGPADGEGIRIGNSGQGIRGRGDTRQAGP